MFGAPQRIKNEYTGAGSSPATPTASALAASNPVAAAGQFSGYPPTGSPSLPSQMSLGSLGASPALSGTVSLLSLPAVNGSQLATAALAQALPPQHNSMLFGGHSGGAGGGVPTPSVCRDFQRVRGLAVAAEWNGMGGCMFLTVLCVVVWCGVGVGCV